MKSMFIFALLLASLICGAQSDSLNMRTSSGKKDGYWKVFLDSQLYVTDSAHAFFYAYNMYDTGKVVFEYEERAKVWKHYRMVYEGNYPAEGQPQLLNGTFLWYQGDSQLVELEIYKNGHPSFWESYQYSKSDSIHPSFYETLNFEVLYNNIPGTFLYTCQFAGAPPTRYWYREGKRRWYSQKIKE